MPIGHTAKCMSGELLYAARRTESLVGLKTFVLARM